MSIDAYRSFIEEKRIVVEKTGHIIDCSMINPDLSPPRIAVDSLISAISKPTSHRYTVARGINSFRKAYADHYFKTWGIHLDFEKNICATSGTKDAVFHFLAATCVQGDSVLVTTPVYPLYEQVASVLGLQVVYVSISELDTKGYQLITDGIVRAVILNSPNNPTGSVLTPETFDKIIDAASNRSISVLNDFVYGEMVSNSSSLLSRSKNYSGLIESYSLSKAYSVCGWRVGAVVGCEELIQRISARRSRFDYGTFLPLQLASSVLLSQCSRAPKDNAARYRERALLVRERLSGTGMEVNSITGLPFIWISLPNGCSSSVLATRLLHERNIAIMPGRVFSEDHDRYARIALVASEDDLDLVSSACAEIVNEIQSQDELINAKSEEQLAI